MMTKQIQIEGMSCMHCVKHVTNALKELNGVSNVVVNLAQKNATIEVTETVSNQVIEAAIQEAGYKAVSIK